MQELASEVDEGDNGDSEAWAPDVKARDLRVESVVVQRVDDRGLVALCAGGVVGGATGSLLTGLGQSPSSTMDTAGSRGSAGLKVKLCGARPLLQVPEA